MELVVEADFFFRADLAEVRLDTDLFPCTVALKPPGVNRFAAADCLQ